jgi:hypothetical protein
MIRLHPPSFGIKEVVQACLSTTRVDRKKIVNSALPCLESSESDYQKHGEKGELDKIIPPDPNSLPPAEQEVRWLYENKLLDKNQQARCYYDRIISSAPGRLCPLCAQRDVSTIDHYLPKSVFPEFAITPLNLVPTCKDCNYEKGNKQPNKPEEQTLHPYFDDLDDADWLVAEVSEQVAPVITFRVQPPAIWPKVKQYRVLRHFQNLKLESLYSSNAMRELSNIGFRLNELANDAGAKAVQDELLSQARSRRKAARNSWIAAMYTALAASTWFWSVGHRKIGG